MEHKYKVGDEVLVLVVSINGIIEHIDDPVFSSMPYKITHDNGHIYWASEDQLQPVEPEQETTTIKREDCFLVCQKCRNIVPPQMENYQFYYCPNCGRRIEVRE